MLDYDVNNRSQQLLLLQNDFFHTQNKRQAKAVVNTNLDKQLIHQGRLAFKQPRRVIHRNLPFERRQSERIRQANRDQLIRLLSSHCQVPVLQRLNEHYQAHQEHLKLVSAFRPASCAESTERKIKVAVNRYDLCSPAFKGFIDSDKHSRRSRVMSWRDPSTRCQLNNSQLSRRSASSMRSRGKNLQFIMPADRSAWKLLNNSAVDTTQ